jgi:hypothetical protein
MLFKSVDGGATWSRRRFGTPAVYVIAVAVEALSPNIVYAGTGDNEGLFKSTDYGDTWASVGTGLSGAITFLTIDPTKSGRLFASTGMAFFLSELPPSLRILHRPGLRHAGITEALDLTNCMHLPDSPIPPRSALFAGEAAALDDALDLLDILITEVFSGDVPGSQVAEP